VSISSIRKVFILLLLGVLVTSQQVWSVNIFLEDQGVDLNDLVIEAAGVLDGPDMNPHLSASVDSIEVTEIEIPANKDTNMVKEVAMVTIVATFAAYIIYTLFFSEDDEEVDDGEGGKDIPTSMVVGSFSH